jgi:2-methylcitrate dehydratase PrpD
LEGACDFPKGDPENPLSGEELIRKFNALTEGILSQDASKALVERAMTLETCPSVDRLLENSS